MTTLIMAIGVSLLIENMFVAQIGATPRAFPDFLGSQSQAPYRLFGNAAISGRDRIFLVSIALMLLQWIVFKTKVGTAMRAVSFNLNSAKLMGINTDAIISLTFAIGSASGGERRTDCAVQSKHRSVDGNSDGIESVRRRCARRHRKHTRRSARRFAHRRRGDSRRGLRTSHRHRFHLP